MINHRNAISKDNVSIVICTNIHKEQTVKAMFHYEDHLIFTYSWYQTANGIELKTTLK